MCGLLRLRVAWLTPCLLTLSSGEFLNADPDASERHTVFQLVVDGSLKKTVLAYTKPTAAVPHSIKRENITQSGVPGLTSAELVPKDVSPVNLTVDVFARVV